MNIQKIIAVIAFTLSSVSYADQANKNALIQEMIQLNSSHQLPAVDSLRAMLSQQGLSDTDAQDAILGIYLPTIKAALAEAYDEIFSESELQDILSFYRTKSGAHFINSVNILNEKTRPAYMSIMNLAQEALAKKTQTSPEPRSSAVTYIEDETSARENFASATAKPGLIVVKCSAAWCKPCQILAPIFQQVAEELPEIAGVPVSYVALDIDAAEEVAQELSITTVPTTLFYLNGALVAREQGVLSKQMLIALIKSLAS